MIAIDHGLGGLNTYINAKPIAIITLMNKTNTEQKMQKNP